MIEVEIRAKVKNLKKIKSNLKKLNSIFVKKIKQVDSIFARNSDLDNNNKIIDGCFIARIREINEKKTLEFKEIKRNGICTEFNIPITNLDLSLNFLNKLGFQESFTISKVRENYTYKVFEISLDKVKRLGSFIEIEHQSKNGKKVNLALNECKKMLRLIDPEAIIEPKKYGDLIQELINKKKQIN
jgi:adenylate cyclase class 2